MANQYDVLGKAPGLEELNKLSPSDVHLTIRGLNAGYGKMEILHNFDLTVSKGQSLCLIGPTEQANLQYFILFMVSQISLMEKLN